MTHAVRVVVVVALVAVASIATVPRATAAPFRCQPQDRAAETEFCRQRARQGVMTLVATTTVGAQGTFTMRAVDASNQIVWYRTCEVRAPATGPRLVCGGGDDVLAAFDRTFTVPGTSTGTFTFVADRALTFVATAGPWTGPLLLAGAS